MLDNFCHHYISRCLLADFSFDFSTLFSEPPSKSEVAVPPSEHEQAEGTIVALAITSTASEASLAAWIKQLEATNPRLTELPVFFKLRQPNPVPVWHADAELSPEQQGDMFPEVGEEAETEEVEEQLNQEGEWQDWDAQSDTAKRRDQEGSVEQDRTGSHDHHDNDRNTESNCDQNEKKQEKTV